MKSWSVEDSIKLYHLNSWGGEYFSINQNGNVAVHPKPSQDHPGVDLAQVVENIRKKNIGLPVLIRFQDVIRKRVIELNETFKNTIEEAGFDGKFKGVYPVKVNQMREVVEEIIEAGRPYGFGLEAGSKAELAAILAMDLSSESLVVCNGYKDYSFIKTALMGLKLGKKTIIVIEKLSELNEVLNVARELDVKPLIGIRAKLYCRGSGRWQASAGDFAKFGLTTSELLHAVNLLREHGLESSFKMLHFHLGSQVTNIRTIKDAVREATRMYAKLRKMGLELEYLDVGGGLGVDYDGSRTSFASSMNYTLGEYVADVVYAIQEICDSEKVAHPDIVNETGRALVAHHSVLIVNAFGSIEMGTSPVDVETSEEESDVVQEMRYVFENLSNKNLLEHFHDALQRKDEALTLFNLGFLSLEERAKVETFFWQICQRIAQYSEDMKYLPEELESLKKNLADQYLCNFSVFQSMLDHWAIEHLFPIMPIHRHHEKPSRHATLADITCDSDGKVSRFTDLKGIRDTLPLHPLIEGEPYYIGFFLMGAYQDIMGDLHNLFGRVNEVHVFMDDDEPDGYYIEEVIRGHHIGDVLSWVQYSTSYLEKRVKLQIDKAIREEQIKPKEGVQLQNFYQQVLHGYTYMNDDHQVKRIRPRLKTATEKLEEF